MNIKKRKVFISGASSGIGEATAKMFAQNGYSLVLLARRKEKLEKIAQELNYDVHLITADVRDTQTLAEELKDLEIDILINNAGLALGSNSFHETSQEDIDQVIQTNILGVTNCTHILLPRMLLRKKGHIINLGSVAGSYPYPGSHVYGGTKAFIKQFSLNLRADLLGSGIRVTCISPGVTETAFSEVRFKGDIEKAKSVYADTCPLKSQDVADVIFYCATLPTHININFVELMSTNQSFSNFAINRTK